MSNEANAQNQTPKRNHGAAILISGIVGIVLLVLPFVVKPGITVWPAIASYALLCVRNLRSRRNYERSLSEYHCLTPDSAEGEDDAALPSVCLIAPARNEEAGIEAAVRSMLALDYPKLTVIVVNDHSTDSTRGILDKLQDEFPALHVIHDPPQQKGWHGKNNAAWHALHTADANAEWILQTDADVVFHPKSLRRGMAYAQQEKIDFLTCVPWLDNRTLAEELALPIGWCHMLTSVRRDQLNDLKSPAIGIGAYMLFRRAAYDACGGHAVFAPDMPDDTLLAATFKYSGARVGAVWSKQMVQVRIYAGYAQLQSFLVRKMRVTTKDSLSMLLVSLCNQLYWLILPLPLGVSAIALHWTHLGVAWALYSIAALAAYVTASMSFRRYTEIAYMRRGLGWAHPLCGCIRGLFTIEAIGQIIFKKPMEWRGRPHSISSSVSEAGTAP